MACVGRCFHVYPWRGHLWNGSSLSAKGSSVESVSYQELQVLVLQDAEAVFYMRLAAFEGIFHLSLQFARYRWIPCFSTGVLVGSSCLFFSRNEVQDNTLCVTRCFSWLYDSNIRWLLCPCHIFYALKIEAALPIDVHARKAKHSLQQSGTDWTEEQGLLFFKGKLYIPTLPHIRTSQIQEAHDFHA